MSGTLVLYPGFVDPGGLNNAIIAAGINARWMGNPTPGQPDQYWVDNLPAAQAIAASYNPMPYLIGPNVDGTGFEDRLAAYAQQYFNVYSWASNGTVYPVTGAQVAAFQAAAVTNLRSLRAQGNAATTPAILNAINITAGWPSNP